MTDPSDIDNGSSGTEVKPIAVQSRRTSRPQHSPNASASNSVQNSLPPEIVKTLETHLVPPKELVEQIENDSATSSNNGNVASSSQQQSGTNSGAETDQDGFGTQSHSHQLLGGAMTRDLYKMKEKEDLLSSQVPRALSSNDLEMQMERAKRIAQLKTPGGFRRHFVRAKAEEEGRDLPGHVTKNFIEFLLMYGNFGGDWYWEDTDGSDESLNQGLLDDGESSRGLRASSSRAIGAVAASAGSLAVPTERTPLLANVPSYASLRSARQQAEYETTGTASMRKTFMLLIKSFIGTGVLFLPRAFYNGGLGFSIGFLILIALLNYYGMLLIVQCTFKIPGSFGELGGILYGPKMRSSVQMSIALSQMGFCMAYFIFVAQNMKDLIAVFTECRYNPDIVPLIFIQLLVYVPLSLIRRLKTFAVTALIADAFILFGLGYIFVYDLEHLMEFGAGRVMQFNPDRFALYIGTACYTFEGIGMVIPICNAMKEPRRFPGLLMVTMVITTAVYIVIAGLSYLAFGDDINSIVLLNLPTGSAWTETAQFLYIFAIVFTFPLLLFPVLKIFEQWMFTHAPGAGKKNPKAKWGKNFLRTVTVVSMSFAAWLGSTSLDHFVSLIGAFACIPLSFIYPALFHYKAIAQTKSQKVKDLLMLLTGLVIMFYVTYVTMYSWISDTGDKPGAPRCPMPRDEVQH